MKKRKPPEAPHRVILISLLVVAAVLVFWNLGRNCLWEDEAQTALVGKNILSRGVPAASDGKNLVSIFPDHRDIRDGISIWQGWFPSYLAAGSMAVFGRTAFGARFPFAAAFVAFIGLYYLFLRKWEPDRNRKLWLTMALLLTCVTLLLHARQCRYYALVPLLNLLIIDSYLGFLRNPRPRTQVLLILWWTVLINSFFPGAFLLGIALLIDLIRRRPPRSVWKGLLIAAGVIVLLNFPMAWFCRIWDRRFGYQSGYDSPAVFGMYLLRYLLTLNNAFFPLLVVVAACAMRWKAIVTREVFKDELSFLFLIVCATQLIGFSLLADFPFTRYLIGIGPFLLFLGAGCVELIALNRTRLAWTIALVIISTNLLQNAPLFLLRLTSLPSARWTRAGINAEFLQRDNTGVSFARGEVKELVNTPIGSPLVDFLRSLINPPSGPIDVIVEYLQQHGKPSDRVKISYGDMPLMFHTDLTIVSSTEDGPPAPEWLIFRHFNPMDVPQEYVRETSRFSYATINLPFPDLQWNNQPDIIYHYYDTPSSELAPPVALLRRQ